MAGCHVGQEAGDEQWWGFSVPLEGEGEGSGVGVGEVANAGAEDHALVSLVGRVS